MTAPLRQNDAIFCHMSECKKIIMILQSLDDSNAAFLNFMFAHWKGMSLTDTPLLALLLGHYIFSDLF